MVKKIIADNSFCLRTIYLRVENLQKSLYCYCDILGFDIIRKEVNNQGEQYAYLKTGYGKDAVQFCITEDPENISGGKLEFGFQATNDFTHELFLPDQKTFPLDFALDENHYLTASSYDRELCGFHIERKPSETLLNKQCEKGFKMPSRLRSNLLDIFIEVPRLAPYQNLFERMGFEIAYNPLHPDEYLSVKVNPAAQFSITFVQNNDVDLYAPLIERTGFAIDAGIHSDDLDGELTVSVFNTIPEFNYLTDFIDSNGNEIPTHVHFIDPNGFKWESGCWQRYVETGC